MLKPVQLALMGATGLLLLTNAALADIGVVDMEAVIQKYSKAQEVSAQSKEKEEGLQKYRDNLLTQLKAAEKLSPVEKKNLEDKLNKQFADKVKEYRDWTSSQQDVIKSAFDKAVQQVSANDKLDLVLPKQAVLQGGKDVTEDVLTIMNKP